MNKKIISLIILVLVLTAIVAGCNIGGNKNTTRSTSSAETTTTDSTEFIDPKTDAEKFRVVNFGGREKAAVYSNSIEFISGEKYDNYVYESEEYRYVYGTETLSRISVNDFGGDTISESDALLLSEEFLSGGVPSFLKYEFQISTTNYYYKIIYTVSRDESLSALSDPPYEKIMAFIPLTKGVAQFWFDPT